MKRQRIVGAATPVFAAFLGFVLVLDVQASLALGTPSSYSKVFFAASALVTPVAGTPLARRTPMPIVSRGVPAHTNDMCVGSYPAGNANDSNYRSFWRTCDSAVSATDPKWLAYDLSSVPARKRSTVVVAWYNDPMTAAYDHTVSGGSGYNIPGDYSIAVNAAPPGPQAPSTGWSRVVTVTSNTLNSRQHVIKMTGYNWLRIHVTASDGSPGNSDVAVNMDVHDARGGVTDSWIFYGDSITQDGMSHDTRAAASGATVGTFAQLVNATKPAYFPAFQNGGIGGLTSAAAAPRIKKWVARFPGTYVALSYGTNDALAEAGDPKIAARFRNNMQTMIRAVLAAGKTPIIPTIPWGGNAKLRVNVPVLNKQVRRLLAKYPRAVRGPDLYSLFEANQALISSDGIHPTADHGYAALRQKWATFAATSIARGNGAVARKQRGSAAPPPR